MSTDLPTGDGEGQSVWLPLQSEDPVLRALLMASDHEFGADAEGAEGSTKGPPVGSTKGHTAGSTKGSGNLDSPQGEEATESASKGLKATRRYPGHKQSRRPSTSAKASGWGWYRFLLDFALTRLKDRELFDGTVETVEDLAGVTLAFALRHARPGEFPSAYESHGLSSRQAGLTLEKLARVARNAASAALDYRDPVKVQQYRLDGHAGGLASGVSRRQNMKAPLEEVRRLRAEGWSRARIAARLGCSVGTIRLRLLELKALAAGVPHPEDDGPIGLVYNVKSNIEPPSEDGSDDGQMAVVPDGAKSVEPRSPGGDEHGQIVAVLYEANNIVVEPPAVEATHSDTCGVLHDEASDGLLAPDEASGAAPGMKGPPVAPQGSLGPSSTYQRPARGVDPDERPAEADPEQAAAIQALLDEWDAAEMDAFIEQLDQPDT